MEDGIKLRLVQALMGQRPDKDALHSPRVERPRQKIGEPCAKDSRSIMERTDQRREEVFKGIAIGENEAKVRDETRYDTAPEQAVR